MSKQQIFDTLAIQGPEADVAKPVSIVFEESWQIGEARVTGKRQTSLPVLKKGERKIWGTTDQ